MAQDKKKKARRGGGLLSAEFVSARDLLEDDTLIAMGENGERYSLRMSSQSDIVIEMQTVLTGNVSRNFYSVFDSYSFKPTGESFHPDSEHESGMRPLTSPYICLPNLATEQSRPIEPPRRSTRHQKKAKVLVPDSEEPQPGKRDSNERGSA